jgi:hypothetical protein
MARKPDAIDCLIMDWAKVRRVLRGISDEKCPRASGYVGPLGCTLGNVKDTWDGASSRTAKDQHYPEVYEGDTFEVNRAFHHMHPTLREIMDAHYVHVAPVKLKVYRLGIKWTDYWDRVRRAKAYVEAWNQSRKCTNNLDG